MSFSIRPYRRFPVQCAATYNAGPFQGQGTVWNLSLSGGTRKVMLSDSVEVSLIPRIHPVSASA